MHDSYDGHERRKADRNEDLVQAVIVAVRAEVASQIMPEDIHREHHTLIGEMIAEMKRKRERHEKIKAQVGGWAIITLLGAVGKGTWELWHLAQEHWK